ISKRDWSSDVCSSDLVPDHLLEDLANSIPLDPTPKTQRTMATSSFDLDHWIEDHGLDVVGPQPWNDGRKWVFRQCPWNSDHRDRSKERRVGIQGSNR